MFIYPLYRQARRKTAPGFKPIGSEGAGTTSLRQPTQVSTNIYQGVLESESR